MALQNWGWVIRGIRGAINLLRELREYGAPINTTHLQELRQCSADLSELTKGAEELNQDLDQGAARSGKEFVSQENDRNTSAPPSSLTEPSEPTTESDR